MDMVSLHAWDSKDLGNPDSNLNYKWTVEYLDTVIRIYEGPTLTIEGNAYKRGKYIIKLEVGVDDRKDYDQTELWIGDDQGSIKMTMKKNLETGQYALINGDYPIGRFYTNLENSASLYSPDIRFFRNSLIDYGYINWTTPTISCQENIVFNTMPIDGNFIIEPKIGYPLETIFNLIAESWENAYNYQYFYVDRTYEEPYVPMTDRVFTNSFSTILPKISNRMEIAIRVYSLSGSYIEKKATVEMQAKEIDKLKVLESRLAEIPINHHEKILQTSLILSSLLNNPAVIFLPNINKCECGTNGFCSNNKCKCNEN